MDKLLTIGVDLGGDPAVARAAERADYQVLHADERSAALEQLRAERPSVILVTRKVGQEDGVALLKELRALDPGSQVVLITDAGDADAAIEVLRAGALDYLHTPIDASQLELALGRARERNRDRQAAEPPAILVVDDHAVTLKHVVRVLTKEGYRAVGATDGRDAMRVFGERKIDVILSDLMMPDQDGFDLIAQTKGVGADVEVIVVTGYGDEAAIVRALRAGAINFLKKPVEIEHMLLSIEKALEYRALRRSLAFREREVQLTHELVVRLTHQLELVVEAPFALAPPASGFLRELVGTLPFGILVLGADGRIVFANRQVLDKTSPPPERVSADWLRPTGLTDVTEAQFEQAFERTLEAAPGHIETLVISKWAFVLMTPLSVRGVDATERCVAIAIRGERQAAGATEP